ncbi:MAG: four helix bundle protein [Clostridia bacterium]|nr:four helix bundle protein [Clostridia bacterium]
MAENVLQEQSLEFATKIVLLCNNMQASRVLTSQLLKSGTSIGANIREAYYAQSPADFISKLHIALKECFETEYWLELFYKTNLILESEYAPLKKENGKMRMRLISSIDTVKEKYNLQ